ncbi:hypothetical protein P4311_26600 [Bacillus thuringiensis]|nr:hypothetical protein [Bacillus thuringiensis]
MRGWQEIEGKTYYFDDCSMLVKDYSKEIDGKLYNIHPNDGSLQRSAWRDDRYYSDAFGAFVKDGLQEIDDKIYYFQNFTPNKNEIRLEGQNIILHFSDKGVLGKVTDLNGNAITSPKTATIDGKQLAFEQDGTIRKKGLTKKRAFLQPDGMKKVAIHYYSLADGATYTGWKEIDGKKYYFKDGVNYTFDGHQGIDGKRYYFNHDGEAKITGFDNRDGKVYYYNDKGVIQTGWKKINDKWYYFQASGDAAIGRFTVWGYFFPSYGAFDYYAREDGSIYQNVNVYMERERDGLYAEYRFDHNRHFKRVGGYQSYFITASTNTRNLEFIHKN